MIAISNAPENLYTALKYVTETEQIKNIIQSTDQGSGAISLTSVPMLASTLLRDHSICQQDLPSTQWTAAVLG